MKTIQLKNIALAYGERDLLGGVSCTLDTTTRAALAGVNGSGKSTLLKVITGEIEPDTGEIAASKDIKTSYLPQSGVVFKERTLFHELESAYFRFTVLLEEKLQIEQELTQASEDAPPAGGLLHRLHDIEEHLVQSDYYHREARISFIAVGLGFTEADLGRSCSEFSGGWQMRIALGKILLEAPDMLLLDEPTNYLDLDARLWLKDHLNSRSGGYLLVSHDRFFLDATTNEVYEIDRGNLYRFSGNYSAYEQAKESRRQQLIEEHAKQQREIARIEDFIERFRYQASKAKQVQSRVKQLEKIEKIEIPDQLKQLSFSFPSPPHSGKDHLTVEHLSKSYGDLQVIKDLDLHVGKGDRIAVTGRNGAGKTTLLRILAGVDTEYSGSIKVGTGVIIGYFAQETETLLHPQLNVLEEIEHDAPTSSIPSLRSYLGSFLFHGDDVYKRVSVLSGGEKSRLALLKILLHPANLLILDEPTNHLDLASKDMLASAVDAYEGTLIFVSHDADFIKKLATKVLYLEEEDGAQLFEGDYDYFTWKLEQKAAEEQEIEDEKSRRHRAEPAAEPVADYQEQNRRRNRIRSLEREEVDLLHAIDKQEQMIAGLNGDLARPENYADGNKAQSIQRQIEELEQHIEKLTLRWDELSGEIEELRDVYA